MKTLSRRVISIFLCLNLLVNSLLPLVVYAQDFDPGGGEGGEVPQEPAQVCTEVYRYNECDWGAKEVYEVYQNGCTGEWIRKNHRQEEGQCGYTALSEGTSDYYNDAESAVTIPAETTQESVSETTPTNGGWSEWSACSQSCGGGIQYRECNNPIPQNSGLYCEGNDTQSCNAQACAILEEPTPEPTFTPPVGLDPELLEPVTPAPSATLVPSPTEIAAAQTPEIITSPASQERVLADYQQNAEDIEKDDQKEHTAARMKETPGGWVEDTSVGIDNLVAETVDKIESQYRYVTDPGEINRANQTYNEYLAEVVKETEEKIKREEQREKDELQVLQTITHEDRTAYLEDIGIIPEGTAAKEVIPALNQGAVGGFKWQGASLDDWTLILPPECQKKPIPQECFTGGRPTRGASQDTLGAYQAKLKEYYNFLFTHPNADARDRELINKILTGQKLTDKEELEANILTVGVYSFYDLGKRMFYDPFAAIEQGDALFQKTGWKNGDPLPSLDYKYALTTLSDEEFDDLINWRMVVGDKVIHPRIPREVIDSAIKDPEKLRAQRDYLKFAQARLEEGQETVTEFGINVALSLVPGGAAARGAKTVGKELAAAGKNTTGKGLTGFLRNAWDNTGGRVLNGGAKQEITGINALDDALADGRSVWRPPEGTEVTCAGVCSIVASAWNKITGKQPGEGAAEQFVAKTPDDLVTKRLLEENNLTPDSIVYRVVDANYVKKGFIEGNPESMATITDYYNMVEIAPGFERPRTLMQAADLGIPSLNVAVEDPSFYAKKPGMVKVGIRVGDMLKQGGKIYRDESGVEGISPLVFTVPEGKVKVVSVVDPKAPIEPSSVVSPPQRLSGGQWVDAKTVDNQIPSTLNIGSEVSVQRSSGQIESGWIIQKVNPDTGKVVVVNYQLGKFKEVTISEVERLNNASLVVPKKASFNEKLVPILLKTIANLVFPREAFAQEQATDSAVLDTIPNSFDQVMNIDEFQLLSTKTDVKNRLLENGQITSEEVRQLLMENSQIPAQGLKDNNRIVVTTGDTGEVEFEVEPGTYKIDSLPIKDVDLFLPATITVSSSDQIIGVGIKKGSGQIKTNGQVTSSSQGQKTAKVKIVTFYDKNSNGVFDSDEKVIPWAGVVVSLTKAVQDKSIPLNAGWNLVSLTSLPEETLTASALLSEISKQGGEATTVSTLADGAWKSYVVRGESDYSMDDFPIEVGKSYFIKVLKPSTFKYSGQNLVAPIKLKLQSGWNAVGLPKTSKEYKASSLIDVATNQASGSGTLAWWDSGLWDTFVKKEAQNYGNNFDILPGFGYILKVEKEAEVTP